MKNKFLLAFLAILILIPTVVAIVNYKKMQTAPADERTAVSITLSDMHGSKTTLEKKEDGDDADKAIKMFLSMIDNATRLVALPDQLTDAPSYLVELSTTVKTTSYKFYFSINPETNYYVAEDGAAFQLLSADATEFLSSDYAASVYEGTEIPTLLLSEQYTVRPASAEWKYTNTAGMEKNAVPNGFISSETETFKIENGFTLDFSVDPDFLALKITDAKTGEVYFNDMYSNLSSLAVKDTTSVAVEVNARWHKKEDRLCYGDFTYRFMTNISAPASFILSTIGTPEPGEFVGITALNVNDVSKIGFSSSPALTTSPVFVKDGANAYAFLPLDVDVKAGEYTLTFSYGGVAKELKLTVAAKTFGESWLGYSAATYNTYGTDTVKNQAETELAPYLAYSAAKQYWSDTFTDGVPAGSTLVNGFGRYTHVLKDGTGTDKTFRHEGVDYYLASNTDITAVNSGEVIYSGIVDYWGYIVIIEHGYGLKSWYCNMGGTSVKAGDKVNRGDKIGVSGSTGFTADLTYNCGAHIALSVFDKFVCPYRIQDNGFTFKTTE